MRQLICVALRLVGVRCVSRLLSRVRSWLQLLSQKMHRVRIVCVTACLVKAVVGSVVSSLLVWLVVCVVLLVSFLTSNMWVSCAHSWVRVCGRLVSLGLTCVSFWCVSLTVAAGRFGMWSCYGLVSTNMLLRKVRIDRVACEVLTVCRVRIYVSVVFLTSLVVVRLFVVT